MPGREDRTQNLIERCELDYVVGSVHFLGELAVDFDRFDKMCIRDRAYADYEDAAVRLEAVVGAAAASVPAPAVDFSAPWRRITLRDAIREQTGIDVIAARERSALLGAIESAGLAIETPGRSWAGLVDDLLSSCVEPTLQAPTFIFDYPVELSPFAKRHRSEAGLAERWEAYAGGIETVSYTHL